MSHCSLFQVFIQTTNLNTINAAQYNVLMGNECCQSSYLTCDSGGIIEVDIHGLGMTGDIVWSTSEQEEPI